MGEVFFLGAGFSKAISRTMPCMEELTNAVKYIYRQRLPPILSNLGTDIEMWLTYLSQPQPWLKDSFNLENRALFLQMTESIGDVINASTRLAINETCPPWFQSLISYWQKHESSIITLNYDTLIERAALLQKVDIENLYPVPLTDVRRASVLGVGNFASFKLYKLHGSVNWYYSGAASFQGEVIYYNVVTQWGKDFDDNEKSSLAAAQDKVPLIAPPISEKTTYFQHETLRQVWLKAAAALQSANCVYCLGYSLPTTDLSIRFLLHFARPDEKIPLYVVNSNTDVISRYQNLLGASYEVRDYGRSIQDIVSKLR
jgi:hypothetical protein